MSAELKPIRIPVAAPLANREIATALTFDTDSMLVNCYIETYEGRKFVVKRPGLSTAFTYNAGGATNGQGTVFYKGGVYAMGSNTLYRLSGNANGSADGSAWTASTAGTWKGRTNFGCIVFNGQIFIMGGQNTGGIAFLNDVWASTDGLNWTQVVSAAPWAKRQSMGLGILGNTLYLIGGDGSDQYTDVWSTTDGVNWTQVIASAPWAKRQGAAVVAFNQGLFFMGGFLSTGTESQEVWFSPDGLTWTQQVTTAAWTGRHYHSALVFGGKIWIAGGNNGGTILQDVWSSPDGITWTNTGNLPAARELMAATVYTGKMWFMTGYDHLIAQTTTVWSTTDGVSFTVATSNYGGNAVAGASAVTFATPTSVSSINAATIWLLGGLDTGAYRNSIYRATLNVSLPSSFVISTGGATTDQFDFATQNAGAYLVFKNTTDAWILYAGTVQKISSTNYPQSTVSGIVNLDDTVFVMDINGVIYGSNLSDPFTWSSLNFITADYESDLGIAIRKYQNYVVAFKSTTTQFYYDAGRYPGSPLLPVLNATCRVGCVAAGSIASMDNTLVFMASTNTFGRYIAALNGFTPVRISDASIERILESVDLTFNRVFAFSIRIDGHDFYVISFSAANITIAYDFTEKTWHKMSSGSNFFSGINYVTDGTTDYLQDYAVGKIYSVNPAVYSDAGANINVSATGDIVDAGTNERKFCSSLTVIGDRRSNASPNNATISWSDDDGQTYSSGVTVDLTLSRPRANRLGSFRRRRHRIAHSDGNNPFRVEAFELGLI